MERLKIAMIVIGGVIGFLGFQEWQLRTVAKDQAQSITASQLAARGPGNNAHIILTDFFPSPGACVYESKRQGGPWTKVWVPIVAMDSSYVQELLRKFPNGNVNGPVPTPTDVRIILKTTKAKDEHELASLFEREGQLHGMVINKIESLGSDEKRLLSESYPGIDISRCYIVDHDRSPAGTGKVLGLLGGGGFLVLGGVAWLVAGRKKG